MHGIWAHAFPVEKGSGNLLKPVYHGETGVRTLRELSRRYLTMVKNHMRRIIGSGRSF